MAVCVAYPTTFQNDFNFLRNATAVDDDYGWYAPLAVILKPIPSDERDNAKSLPYVMGNQLPTTWPLNPWHSAAQPNPYQYYGTVRNHTSTAMQKIKLIFIARPPATSV